MCRQERRKRLEKVFAPIWKQKGSLFIQGADQLIDEAKHAGFDVWTGGFESWAQNEDKSLHIHLGEDEEAKEATCKSTHTRRSSPNRI